VAKPSTPVDRAKLEAALREAEKDGPLANLTKLWEAAAAIYNKNPGVTPITFSVVLLRAKEWNIQVKTQPGRKGGPMSEEHKAALLAGRGQRKPRAEKMKDFASTFDALRRDLNAHVDTRRFLPVVDAAEKGSLTAAVKLKCLDCCNWQTGEIKLCTANDCSLFPHRPYKPGAEEGDEAGDESVPDEELEEAAA
jgi:hypothetical protein